MTLSTTIKKEYFNMKMEDLKKNNYFEEYKELKPFWDKRIYNLMKKHNFRWDGFREPKPEIVFLVGQMSYRFLIHNIRITSIIPKKYKNAIKTNEAFVITCIEKPQQ